MFKLNKLHRSQNPSATNSVTTSPRPAIDHTPSPSLGHNVSRYGHSLSVSNPPPAPTYNPAAAFNPFGPQATLGSDQIFPRNQNTDRPPPMSPNSVGGPSSRPLSRPDFIRGFGLDIPEEEEPPEEADADNEEGEDQDSDMELVELEANVGVETEDEGMAMLNRIHSRHVSRLSAALSLRSVGHQQDSLPDVRSPVVAPMVDGLDLIEKETDGVAEWTGSEDLRGGSDEVLSLASIFRPLCFLQFSRRALGNGPIHPTKNVQGKSEGRGEWLAAQRAHCRTFPENYQISHDRHQPHISHHPIKGTLIFYRIPATKRRFWKSASIPNCHPLGQLDTGDHCLPFLTRVQHPLSSHTTTLQQPIRERRRSKSFPTHRFPLRWRPRFLPASDPSP